MWVAALVCKVSLNVVHISFTFTASESYMMVIESISDAISDLMRSQLARLYNGIWRGFWLYLMGLRSNSANMMSWSETPGSTSTLRILSGWLVMRRSRVLEPNNMKTLSNRTLSKILYVITPSALGPY